MNKTLTCFFLLIFAGSSAATELVYTPVNPSFGGNPANGSDLLGQAQAQNTKKAPTSSRFSQTSELDRFNASLESRLLSQLLADLGQGGTNTGSLSTSDFLVTVEQGTNGLVIRTKDKNTGETTEISVDGLRANNNN